MALFKVVRDCAWAKMGDWLEELEPGVVQKVDMVQQGSRLVPYTNYGLVFPLSEVQDSVVRIQKHGVDRKW